MLRTPKRKQTKIAVAATFTGISNAKIRERFLLLLLGLPIKNAKTNCLDSSLRYIIGFLAHRAVGTVYRAKVDAVLSGKCRNAYALVRPPGHHATKDAGGGFCVFNNIALATEHALRKWRDKVSYGL